MRVCASDHVDAAAVHRKEVFEMIKEKKSGGELTVARTVSVSVTVSVCAGGRTALLSEDRWVEMDWDSDGCITFKVCPPPYAAFVRMSPHRESALSGRVCAQEFLSAMYEWVGVDETD